MKTELGRMETQFFAYTQMRGWRTVRTGDLLAPLRITAEQERKLLSRLSWAGMIARVWRGLYLVPPRLPVGGKWSPEEGLALATLMEARGGGRYQICGANAFNRYGFTDQLPNRTYAYNNRLSGERQVGSLRLTMIKVADARLGGTEDVPGRDGPPAVYSSRARSLVDAVYDWSRFGSLPAAYDWIRDETRAGKVTPAELVDLTLRYGDVGTKRRIGALLDREGAEEPALRKLERALPPTTSPIPWVPRRPKRGPVTPRWAVVWNNEA